MHHANFNQPNENKILFTRPSKRIFIMMQILNVTVLKGDEQVKDKPWNGRNFSCWWIKSNLAALGITESANV